MAKHSYLSYWIINGTFLSDKSQEMDHVRLWDDAKLQLKQPDLGWIKPIIFFAVYIWALKNVLYNYAQHSWWEVNGQLKYGA